MDIEQRSRLSAMGLGLLKEVALDALEQASQDGKGWLTTSDVKNNITLLESDYPGWQTCQDVMFQLEREGLVEREERHPRRWYLRRR